MAFSTRLAMTVAAAAIAMAAPATAATTIAWTQGSEFDALSQSFAPVTANRISFAGTDTSYGSGLTGPMAHSHSQPMNWSIVLTVNGVDKQVFTEFLQGGQTQLSSLGTISFAGGSVSNLTLNCDSCSGFTYHQFGDTTFTLSAVPEPASWALMIAGFGMVGVAVRRRSSVVTT